MHDPCEVNRLVVDEAEQDEEEVQQYSQSQNDEPPGGVISKRRLALLMTASLLAVLALSLFSVTQSTSSTVASEAPAQHVIGLAASTPADCCTSWSKECYTTNGPNNKEHACKACGSEPCEDICDSDPDSRACQLCCTRFPDHETDWVCDSTHGLGKGDGWKTDTRCKSVDYKCWQQSYKQMTLSACASWCESWGLPGCCSVSNRTTPFLGECNFYWAKTPEVEQKAPHPATPEVHYFTMLFEGDGAVSSGCMEGQNTPHVDATTTTTTTTSATTTPTTTAATTTVATPTAATTKDPCAATTTLANPCATANVLP